MYAIFYLDLGGFVKKFQRGSSVATALAERKWWLAHNGDKGHDVRAGLFVSGDVMASVFAGGVVTAIHLCHLTNVFSAIGGISAGAACVAHLLSKTPLYGNSIFYRKLNGKQFINFARLKMIADIDLVASLLATGPESLDHEAVLRSMPFFNIWTSNRHGESVLHNARLNTVDIVKASMAMPIFYNKPVMLEGEPHFDGVASEPLPLKQFIERYKLTHLLVVLSSIPGQKKPGVSTTERLVTKAFMQKYPALRNGLLQRHERFATSIHEANRLECEVEYLLPDADMTLSKLCRDRLLLQTSALHGAMKVWDVFGRGPMPTSEILVL